METTVMRPRHSIHLESSAGWRRPVHCLATARALFILIRRDPSVPGPDVKVHISPGPRNSRFVFASLDVDTPVDAIWNNLTDYNRLDEFIPSLAKNECLERTPKGALLKQVGQQNLAFGVKFCASVVLRIGEHINGLNRDLCWTDSQGIDWNENRWFPSPGYIDGPSPRDLTFELVRGDFQAFKGVWRMQSRWRKPELTRLSYGLFVRPQLWLPVGLVQGLISMETANNLQALKEYTEQNAIGV